MPHFDEAMRRLREEAKTTTQAGRAFERLMKAAFERHPAEWGPLRFKQVWLWSEWREECRQRGEDDPGPDIGIDMVAEQTPAFGGGLCAIQCKNHESASAATNGVDKFLAATANVSTWAHRVFIATTRFSKNAQKKLANAGNATLLTGPQLDCWAVGDWRHIVVNPDALRFSEVDRHTPREDQEDALAAIKEGLFDTPVSLGGSRGRVIMPCGTGKTAVTLWAAERNVGLGGRVLYLVPSIALLGQTMREWAEQQSVMPRYLGVCSDTKAGRDSEDVDLSELALPVTTDVTRIVGELKREAPEAMTVVFSTYQSLPTIVRAQEHGAPAFDLVISDEAHRTAGHQDSSGKQKAFTLVHDASRLRAHRRLYVTATPRVYSDKTQSKADELGIDLYSMDDEIVFGPRLFQMGFAEAVEKKLLTDYQVVIVAVDDSPLGGVVPSEKAGDLDTEQVQQLLGCWDGLADPNTQRRPGDRPAGVVNPDGATHVRRAIAFTNTIKHSENVAEHWWATLRDERDKNDRQYNAWKHTQVQQDKAGDITELDVEHVDGKMNAYERAQRIAWLREVGDDGEQGSSRPVAKVLSNARCLTEGVDVPALDAVLFLSPRKSEIDVVQAVGRVMRKSKGKQTGYVILPVLVPPGKTGDAEDVLASSAYKSVWQVLRALRAHDERMEGYLASPSLARRKAPVVIIDNTSAAKERADDIDAPSHQEQPLPLGLPLTVAAAIVDRVGDRQYWARWGDQVNRIVNIVASRIDAAVRDPRRPEMGQLFAEFAAEFRQAVRVDHLSDHELVQTLASHIVTAPVLDALFAGDDFAKSNPMSRALEAARAKLLGEVGASPEAVDDGAANDGDPGDGAADDDAASDDTASDDAGKDDVDPLRLKVELRQLSRFHDRMERQLGELTDPDDRLEALRSLYESFFQKAMPDAAAQLGIAYTNQRVVDFMLRSVDAAVRAHFDAPDGVGGVGLNVVDPFTGTGTFIYRLLTGDNSAGEPLIPAKNVDAKYFNDVGSNVQAEPDDEPSHPELLANELLLLAYYVAALKIEDGYRERKEREGEPVSRDVDCSFQGLVLVDTFNSGRPDNPCTPEHMRARKLDLTDADLADNAARSQDRKVRVVIGNPPWSSGQDDAGQDLTRVARPAVSDRITATYSAAQQELGGSGGNAAGNLYVQAFRWATDELNPAHGGVVAFVHPNSLLEGTSLAGMRACFREDFDFVYVVDLRGNAYKSGAEWELEGDKVFEQSSRNGVQLTVAVKLPEGERTGEPGEVRLAQCSTRLTREQKLKWLDDLRDVMSDQFRIVPDNPRHDWVNISDGTFEKMLPVCAKQKARREEKEGVVVDQTANGVTTGLDDYVYAYSRVELATRARALISAFNEALDVAIEHVHIGLHSDTNRTDAEVTAAVMEATTNSDLERVKWTEDLRKTLKASLKRYIAGNGEAGDRLHFDEARMRLCQYRPFQKMWLYWDERILARSAVGKLFPQEYSNGGGGASQGYSHHQPIQQGSLRSHPDNPDLRSLRGRHTAGEQSSSSTNHIPIEDGSTGNTSSDSAPSSSARAGDLRPSSSPLHRGEPSSGSSAAARSHTSAEQAATSPVAPRSDISDAPPPPSDLLHHQPPTPLRPHLGRRRQRSLRHWPPEPHTRQAATATVTTPSLMFTSTGLGVVFGVLPTMEVPNLTVMGAGRPTRVAARTQTR